MTKIEEVARAICCPDGCKRGKCDAGDQEGGWVLVQPHAAARAAIEAMREPSEAMMLAWLTQQEYGDSKTLMRAKHSAMIDAALKETP